MQTFSPSRPFQHPGFAPFRRLAIVAACLSAVVYVPLMHGEPREVEAIRQEEMADMKIFLQPTRARLAQTKPYIEDVGTRSVMAKLGD